MYVGSRRVGLGPSRDNVTQRIFSGKFLVKEYCGGIGFESSWVVIQEGTDNFCLTVDDMKW